MADDYKLRTVADFAALRKDQIDECLADFRTWLLALEPTSAFLDDLCEASGVPKGSVMQVGDVFHWCDDGKRGVSAVTLTDLDGTHIHTIDLTDAPKD